MGTNYYLHKTNAEGFNEILHIGKSSVGWRFVFRGYDNIQCRYDWIMKMEGGHIFDEYDRKITYDSFWEMVESKIGDRHGSGLDDALIGEDRFTFRTFS